MTALFWLVAAALARPGAGVVGPAAPSPWSDTAPSDTPWWALVDDPGLASVIDELLAENLDLAAAGERVRQARAARDQALSAVLPQLTYDTSVNAQPANRRFVAFTGQPADGVDGLYYIGTTGFNAALEVDLFGRSMLGAQAAGADAKAGAEDQAEAALNLASRAAAAWYDVAVQTRSLALIEEQVAQNRAVLEVVELRLARGEATAVDVLQQRQQVAASEARLPLARAALAAAQAQLTVLLGRAPDDLPTALPSEVPALGPAPAAGSAATLDAARPDLRGSQERLTAAWRRRMAAQRQFLPTLRLSANAGWSFTNNRGAEAFGGGGVDFASILGPLYTDVGIHREVLRANGFDLPPIQPPDLGGGDTNARPTGFQSWFNYGVGGQISMPLFLGGRHHAGLRAAKAAERAAAHTLNGQRVAAWGEVESALAADQARTTYLLAIEAQAEAAEDALQAARAQYGEGVGDYLSLLTNLVASQNADLALLQARRDALLARIALHDALGGAWTRTLAGGGR